MKIFIAFFTILILVACVAEDDPNNLWRDNNLSPVSVMVTVTPTPTVTPIIIRQVQTIIVTATPIPENFVYDETGRFTFGYLIYNLSFLGISILLLFIVVIAGKLLPR